MKVNINERKKEHSLKINTCESFEAKNNLILILSKHSAIMPLFLQHICDITDFSNIRFINPLLWLNEFAITDFF